MTTFEQTDRFAQPQANKEYADEEVASTWGYPPEYTGPAPIAEQVGRLAMSLRLSPRETMRFVEQVLPTLTLPDGAEGWFAIPSVSAIAARHFESVTNPDERHCRAALFMLDALGELQEFRNHVEERITPGWLRQCARTSMMLERIGETQKGEILIIPSQFGLGHAGRSARRSQAVYAQTEFGHDVLGVGSMLLAHPTRLARWEQLHVICAGDEFAPRPGDVLPGAPTFRFFGKVGFYTNPVNHMYCQLGASTGFAI